MDLNKHLEDRGTWGNWFEFLFAFLGSMVGYGNIWRFPYICYRNGGGAFLIPFFVCLFVCGVPMVFLQTLCSQYSNYGTSRVWEMCPLFKGIGVSALLVVFIVSIYYTMIMAWTVFYLVYSFSTTIPWSTCDNEWNTENCTVELNQSIRVMLNGNRSNTSWMARDEGNISTVSPAEDFWFHKALSISSGIDDTGIVRWELVLCLLASWVVVFLCQVRGIKGVGKVAYVATSLPYVILTCLFIRGLLLPGSENGLYYFLVPRWELLGNQMVWRDAATQMFYSLGLGSGAAATLASYNKFHNNCHRDSILLSVLDCLTSVFGGMVIFSYLGHTSYLTDKPMDQVVAQGPGLVFIAYPVALTTLPLPQLWSVLFFFMLFVMGLNSQYVHTEILATSVVDWYPQLLPRKLIVTSMFCVVLFLLGLPLTTQAGVYILDLMDWYIASVSVLLSCILQCLVAAWIYGTDQLCSNVEHMLGYRPSVIYKYCWKFLCPLFMVVLWVMGFVNFQSISTKLEGFNPAADAGGVALALIPFVPMPAMAAWEVFQREGTLTKRLKDAVRPTPMWRPAIQAYKEVDTAGTDQVDHKV